VQERSERVHLFIVALGWTAAKRLTQFALPTFGPAAWSLGRRAPSRPPLLDPGGPATDKYGLDSLGRREKHDESSPH
jgi:hypothetical protein